MFVWNPETSQLTEVTDKKLKENPQSLVGGYFECANIGPFHCYVNEEALIDGKEYYATIFANGEFMLGNIVFISKNEKKIRQYLEGVQIKKYRGNAELSTSVSNNANGFVVEQTISNPEQIFE